MDVLSALSPASRVFIKDTLGHVWHKLLRILLHRNPDIVELICAMLYLCIGAGIFLLDPLWGPIYAFITDSISPILIGTTLLIMGILQLFVTLCGPLWIRRGCIRLAVSLWLGMTFFYLFTPIHRIGASTCFVFTLFFAWAYARLGYIISLVEKRQYARARHHSLSFNRPMVDLPAWHAARTSHTQITRLDAQSAYPESNRMDAHRRKLPQGNGTVSNGEREAPRISAYEEPRNRGGVESYPLIARGDAGYSVE